MKKILGMLATLGLIATSGIATISCVRRVEIKKVYNNLSSIENKGVWKTSQAFVSRDELKEILTTNGNGTNNVNKQYAINRLKALAANEFTDNKNKSWEDLQKADLVFYRETAVNVNNPNGLKELKKEDDFKDLDDTKDQKLKFIFKTNGGEQKTSQSLDVILLPNFFKMKTEVVSNSTLNIDKFETPIVIEYIGKSIVDVFREHLSWFEAFLTQNGVKDANIMNPQLENAIKNSSKFNELLISLSSYLSDAVRLANSESGRITPFGKNKINFKYETRSSVIYNFLRQNPENTFKVVKGTLFNHNKLLESLNNFTFDKNEKELKINKADMNSNSTSSPTQKNIITKISMSAKKK
ncbi:hypothetical protein [Mycoplasma putrefaciens]|uniref:Lipoprotein n=1 Tax=Mycoplasma putrefaciens (strain ATCC 15718 / NCTC 10155 / C30 KS-1 / KS-1) TaxID=743965 RepID=A0A7U4E9F6_MYCPK|nr:hypothetical protein [Mycoplasma putrefaciens]AEM68817.1 lipoprotein [Mycoplasma putrefaciens KS1]